MHTNASAPPASPSLPLPARLDSVDLLRGVVMVIMALDHVRDYFSDRLFMNPVDLTTTTPGIFLTRWVTHYCAPTFVFLAGTGAFLAGARGKTKHELAWFLVTRGLWLALLDLTVIRASWMFNFDPCHHGVGVIWVIGWSMVVLAGLIYLPPAVTTAFGVTMIVFHNLLDGLSAQRIGLPEWLWVVLHQPGDAPVLYLRGGQEITFGTGYCLIPWVGVMAVGYGFGTLLMLTPERRRKCLLALGTGLTLGFIALRTLNLYGDPVPWSPQHDALFTFFSFLNCTKYPPSLLYLLMTLGPAILFLALADRARGPLTKPLITFGRVPLFFYLLHIPLIHGAAVLLDHLRFGWSPQTFDGPWAVRPGEVPDAYGVDLSMVYVIWIAVVLILYPPCRWFAELKKRRREAWLSYL